MPENSDSPAVKRRDAGVRLVRTISGTVAAGSLALTGGVTLAAQHAYASDHKASEKTSIAKTAKAAKAATKATTETAHKSHKRHHHHKHTSSSDSLASPSESPTSVSSSGNSGSSGSSGGGSGVVSGGS